MLEFAKIHGCGNSFVILEDLQRTVRAPARLARHLCDYRTGIGADGLILAHPSRRYDFTMSYWNADGSKAEMCGNGIRCITKFLSDRKRLPHRRTTFETGAGPITTTIVGTRRGPRMEVLVDMGPPAFTSKDLARSGPGPHLKIPLHGRRYTFVSMGNPHAVTFVDAHDFDISSVGSRVEHARAIFPNKTNVEFVQRVDTQKLRVRVWERGCGVTAACGTGACASVVAAIMNGVISRKRSGVVLDGGTLTVTWQEDDEHVLMQGEAVVVAEGTLFDG